MMPSQEDATMLISLGVGMREDDDTTPATWSVLYRSQLT